MKKSFSMLATLALVSGSLPLMAIEYYPLTQVKISQQSVFNPAIQAARTYILSLDADRLLAPFRRNAGLPEKAKAYGNWESSGLDGHTLGHYLSALVNLQVTGNDADGQAAKRLDYILEELELCQEKQGNGRLDGIPKGDELWRALKKRDTGRIRHSWVPWYNVHKTFAGLRDAAVDGKRPKAKKMLLKLADWVIDVTSELNDNQFQQMLDCEYGGMNEVFADLASLTGNDRYLEAARRWEHKKVFDPLYAHQDRLTGLHANTQIPKFIGLAQYAKVAKDEKRRDAADFVWQTITKHRSVAFGGNSVREHFHPADNFAVLMADREGPETCNTYNMLRLSELLFELNPKAEYAAYYEKALFNHILSSINTHTPGFVYFTSVRPAHYRVYSTPQNCFWCCVGTGMENVGRYGRFIYAHEGANTLYVNLFIDSELKGILRQRTNFPETGKSEIEFLKPFQGTLYVREGDHFTKKVGNWKKGAKLTFTCPMDWHVEMLPDGSDWGAILRGPIVMARDCGTERLDGLFAGNARMGHVAYGPVVPADQIPYRLKNGKLDTTGLVPFYTLHECRYQIYWEFTTKEKIEAAQAALKAAEEVQRQRDEATIDFVRPGEQQSETEHDFTAAERTSTGIHNGRRWRDGRWFSYTLDTRGEKNVELEVTYTGDDRGRKFDLVVNGRLIKQLVLPNRPSGTFYAEKYALDPQILGIRADKRILVQFIAGESGLAGGIFDLRLMKAAK